MINQNFKNVFLLLLIVTVISCSKDDTINTPVKNSISPPVWIQEIWSTIDGDREGIKFTNDDYLITGDNSSLDRSYFNIVDPSRTSYIEEEKSNEHYIIGIYTNQRKLDTVDILRFYLTNRNQHFVLKDSSYRKMQITNGRPSYYYKYEE